jgi:hypothetical protein
MSTSPTASRACKLPIGDSIAIFENLGQGTPEEKL